MTRLRSLAAAALALVGCGHYTHDPFPIELGFQPLEACAAPLPDPIPGGDPYPEVQTSITGNRDGHDWAHSKAYVHASLGDVWAAMQDPAVCRIHGTNTWQVRDVGLEPFPMSFLIDYTAGPSYYTVEWEITYRGGVLEGTADAPLAYGVRGQKTWGTSYVHLQSISVDARPVQGQTSIVVLEMVGWLSARDSGQAEAAGMLSDFYQGLLAHARGLPVP
jgi:hypothetical protein